MEDNDKKLENKTDNKLNEQLLKNDKSTLLNKLKKVDFRKDEIKTGEDKQRILKILLGDYMENIKWNMLLDFNDLKESNEGFILLKERIIEPILNPKTDINLLKIINKHISDKDNCYKLLQTCSPLLTNENCEKYVEILEKLIIIFNYNKSYQKELKKTLKSVFALIKNSRTKEYNPETIKNDYDEKEVSDENDINHGIKFVYKLLYKLALENESLCKIFIYKDLIKILIEKLPEHVKAIRNIIYNIILYLLKNLEYYNKKNFNFSMYEKEGKIRINPDKIFSLKNYINSIQSLILYKDRPEILKILFTIISRNNSENISKIEEFKEQIFSKYENSPEKLYPLLDIISSQIQINDQNTYERLIKMAGYSSLVVRPIPKEENQNDSLNNSFESNSDNEYIEKNEQKIKTKKKENQKWPLFGERLIDGNIFREIYEYLTSNHNKSYQCLLAILFPSEYRLLDGNKTIKISEEKKKEILLDMLKSIFNERNNYPLFKYLYLLPSRSLLYKNLYSEIISYLDIYNKINLPFNLEIMKIKEKKYKEFLQKEIKRNIEKSIKINLWNENDYNDNMYKGNFFECRDKNMTLFTGFIADIIPGEVIREDIFGIAKNSESALYRIHYYTKYYQMDELRKSLLNPDNLDKKKKEDNKDDKKSIKSNESKSSKKPKLLSSSLNINHYQLKKQKKKRIRKKMKIKKSEKDKKSEKERKKSDDEEEKKSKEYKILNEKEKKTYKEKLSYSRKSSSDSKNSSSEENEEIQKKVEYSNSEIEEELDEKGNVKEYDVSEKNENDFIYYVYKNSEDIFILEDKGKKDRNNVKNFLIRYIFTHNGGVDNKNFTAKIKETNSLKSQTKSNCHIMSDIKDSIEPYQMTCFWNLQRFKDELKFVSKGDIILHINLHSNN